MADDKVSSGLAASLRMLQTEAGNTDVVFEKLIANFKSADTTFAKNRGGLEKLQDDLDKFAKTTLKGSAGTKKAQAAQTAFNVAQDSVNQRSYQKRLSTLNMEVAAARGAGDVTGAISNRIAQGQIKIAESIYAVTGIQSEAALGAAGKAATIGAIIAMSAEALFGGLYTQSRLAMPALSQMGVGLGDLSDAGWQAGGAINKASWDMGALAVHVFDMRTVVELMSIATTAGANSLNALNHHFTTASASVESMTTSIIGIASAGAVLGMSAEESIKAMTNLGVAFHTPFDELEPVMVALREKSADWGITGESLIGTLQAMGEATRFSSRSINDGFRDLTAWAGLFKKIGVDSGKDLDDLMKSTATIFAKSSPLWYMAVTSGAPGTRKMGEGGLVDAIGKGSLERGEAILSKFASIANKTGKGPEGKLDMMIAMLTTQGGLGLDAKTLKIAQLVAGKGPGGETLKSKAATQEMADAMERLGQQSIDAQKDPVSRIVSYLMDIVKWTRMTAEGGLVGALVGNSPVVLAGGPSADAVSQAGVQASRSMKGHDNLADKKPFK